MLTEQFFTKYFLGCLVRLLVRRRNFLAFSTLAMTGEAGCSKPTETPGSTSSPASTVSTTANKQSTDTSTDSTTPTAASLSAELDSLQPAVVIRRSADTIGVESVEGTQYLYLYVTVESGAPPAREALQLRFDGQEFEPSSRDRELWRAYTHGNSRYDAESGRGWLLFDLPETGDASNVALIEADGPGEWPVVSTPSMNFDGRLRAKSPPLSVAWSVPDTVELGDTPTLSFTVTNEGDHDGVFVGALNRSGPSIARAPTAAIREVIPPGEPTTFKITDSLEIGDPGEGNTADGEYDMRYDLYWTGQSRSQQIPVVASSD